MTEADSEPWAYCDPVQLTARPSGGWIVAFSRRTSGIDVTPIRGRLVAADGTTTGSPFLLSTAEYSDIETYTLAWSPQDSRFLMTWKANVTEPTSRFPDVTLLDPQQLVGRFIAEDGTGIGVDLLLTNNAEGFDNNQDVARGADRWVVVGTAEFGSRAIMAQVVDATGPVGAPVAVSSSTSAGPSILHDATRGEFLATWFDTSTGDLMSRRLDAAGAPIGTEQTVADGRSFRRPRVVQVGTDRHRLLAHAFNPVGSYLDLFSIELDGTGAATGAPDPLVEGDALSVIRDAFRPAITAIGGGDWIAVFWGQGQVGSATDLYLVSSSSLGARVVTTPPPAAPPGPSVTCTPTALSAGGTVTCTLSDAPGDTDFLWRAAYNPTFAEGVVRSGADGTGTFTFVVPRAALGATVTVELVAWTGPIPIGVAGSPLPRSVAAGGGPAQLGVLTTVLLAAALAGAATVRLRTRTRG